MAITRANQNNIEKAWIEIHCDDLPSPEEGLTNAIKNINENTRPIHYLALESLLIFDFLPIKVSFLKEFSSLMQKHSEITVLQLRGFNFAENVNLSFFLKNLIIQDKLNLTTLILSNCNIGDTNVPTLIKILSPFHKNLGLNLQANEITHKLASKITSVFPRVNLKHNPSELYKFCYTAGRLNIQDKKMEEKKQLISKKRKDVPENFSSSMSILFSEVTPILTTAEKLKLTEQCPSFRFDKY